jgi:hypothetical protein
LTNIKAEDTALVVTDPQNDVLSTTGVVWELVGESIRENNAVEHLEQLFVICCSHAVPTGVERGDTGG